MLYESARDDLLRSDVGDDVPHVEDRFGEQLGEHRRLQALGFSSTEGTYKVMGWMTAPFSKLCSERPAGSCHVPLASFSLLYIAGSHSCSPDRVRLPA